MRTSAQSSLLQSLPTELVADHAVRRLGVFGQVSLDLIEITSDKRYPPHYHENSDSEVYIVRGRGHLVLDGNPIPYRANEQFWIPRGMWHHFEPSEPTLYLSQQSPQIKDQLTGIDDMYFA